MRARVVDRINKMSANQLQFFLQDMQQKLTLINSQAAYKAQANILYNLNVASDAYAARLRMQLPNLVTMTADQVRQTLVTLQQQEDETRSDEAAFQKSNAQEVALIQAQKRTNCRSQRRSRIRGPRQLWRQPVRAAKSDAGVHSHPHHHRLRRLAVVDDAARGKAKRDKAPAASAWPLTSSAIT